MKFDRNEQFIILVDRLFEDRRLNWQSLRVDASAANLCVCVRFVIPPLIAFNNISLIGIVMDGDLCCAISLIHVKVDQ